MFRYQQSHIPHSSNLALLKMDNIRNSSKNSKEGSSQEVSKAIMKTSDIDGKKHIKDKLKKSKGSKSQSGSSTGTSVI